jgi:hypothetical protein
MNGIKHIRENLFISQEHLAAYLNITRSQLAMAEASNRELPLNALLKLDELFLRISSEDDIHFTSTELNEQQNELQFFLQEEENANNIKAKQLQAKLTNIKSNYNKALQLLQAVRSLQQKLPNIPANKKDLLWLKVMEAEAIGRIIVNGLVAQHKLQIKINALSNTSI